ncbi:MAG: glycosyltransferase family 2 protein [Proteobacteria bacterium]|nr:glycosyltransferase family 2 protein [Pseudomonadota bacterium]MCP4917417.1 glycosyltransferase family 2 protein [Pseudomonadota bacterium]
MISAVVVTHKGGELLRRCVASLESQLHDGDELLVVVSAEPGTCDVEAVSCPVLDLESNPLFARAANAGFERTSGELILLLNDDTCAQPGFVDAFRGLGPGLYQPRIRLADGTGRLDNVGHGLFPDGFNWARGREDQDGQDYQLAGEVGACSGAAMGIHRAVLDRIGPFDEDLQAFGEDVDLSLRAWRAGFELVYLPHAVIEHELGASYGRYGPEKIFLVERNRVRVAVRNLPLGAVLTMPMWTSARLAGLGLASLAGRGWSARVPEGAGLAALRGLASGLASSPEAWRKRRSDTWVRGERAGWAHLWRNRVRLRDVLR